MTELCYNFYFESKSFKTATSHSVQDSVEASSGRFCFWIQTLDRLLLKSESVYSLVFWGALWHHSAVTSQRGKQVWKHFGFFIPGSSRGIRGTKTSLVTRLRLLYDNLLKNNKINFSFLFWYINVILKLLLLLICEFLLFYIFVLWYHQQRADGGGSRFLFCWLMVLFYCPQ